MIMFIFISLILYLLSCQVKLGDFKLLLCRYNFKIRIPQLISYFCFLICIAAILSDIMSLGFSVIYICVCSGTLLSGFICEWLLSRINSKNRSFTISYRLIINVVISTLAYYYFPYYTPFIILGLYFRNTFLGVVHPKDFCISTIFSSKNYKHDEYINNDGTADIYNAASYGILPDTNVDQTEPLQRLIDEVGIKGGGIIQIPRGRYLFNKDKHHKKFLKINYSNITIEGETDANGIPITELVCCNSMPDITSNPWLNPFFITTGESLQQSNIFWGLQFRKKKDIITQSNSLSDPGSDGSLQTPEYATKIIADIQKGEIILKVEDSKQVGKYILIGMYNTTADGNLLKDILGVDQFRPEWGTALRAGDEEAPSFQWLVGVRSIIDEHTIELSHPLFRPIEMKYEPAIFNVDMLENINIKNLKLSAKWNGLFHHHGFPLYYSVRQSREMDYGWNGINLKRAAHSSISNIIIQNYSTPIYLQDSFDSTVNGIFIKGYDGHQGIKVYCHTSHCTISNITFTNHYADMLVAEGNSYCNHFHHISYINQEFKPVDFDFHGFAEGPMSPPSDNRYELITGFRYIKSAGAIYNQPALAQRNSWSQITTEGEKKGTNIFYSLPYRQRNWMVLQAAAIGTALIAIIKSKRINSSVINTYRSKLQELRMRSSFPRRTHRQFFKGTILKDIRTQCNIPLEDNE